MVSTLTEGMKQTLLSLLLVLRQGLMYSSLASNRLWKQGPGAPNPPASPYRRLRLKAEAAEPDLRSAVRTARASDASERSDNSLSYSHASQAVFKQK